jgi:hypothetical protein
MLNRTLEIHAFVTRPEAFRIAPSRIIEDGKAAGVMRRDVDSSVTSHVILGMLAGASQQALTTRALTLPRLMTEAKEMTLAYLLRSPA